MYRSKLELEHWSGPRFQIPIRPIVPVGSRTGVYRQFQTKTGRNHPVSRLPVRSRSAMAEALFEASCASGNFERCFRRRWKLCSKLPLATKLRPMLLPAQEASLKAYHAIGEAPSPFSFSFFVVPLQLRILVPTRTSTNRPYRPVHNGF